MSDKSMVDFVSEYFKRLIFLNMPDEQFVRFCEYVDKDDLGGNMKYWRNQLLRKDGDEYVKDPATKLYVRKEVPDPVEETPGDDWQLTDAEWEKMYNAFNDAFQSMYSKKKSLEYPNPNDKAKEFLERFFGPDAKVKLFAYTTASREAEEKIQEAIAKKALEKQTKMAAIQYKKQAQVSNISDKSMLDDSIKDLIDKSF